MHQPWHGGLSSQSFVFTRTPCRRGCCCAQLFPASRHRIAARRYLFVFSAKLLADLRSSAHLPLGSPAFTKATARQVTLSLAQARLLQAEWWPCDGRGSEFALTNIRSEIGRKAGVATMSLFGGATVTKDSIYDFSVKVRHSSASEQSLLRATDWGIFLEKAQGELPNCK